MAPQPSPLRALEHGNDTISRAGRGLSNGHQRILLHGHQRGLSHDHGQFTALVGEVLSAAKAGEAVEVVVVRLDRWGRSLPDVVTTLTKFQDAGVRFRSLTEAGVTLDGSPSSMLVITVLAAAASYERTLMMARVAEAKRAKGTKANGGRPRALSPALVNRAAQFIETEGLSVPAAAAKVGVSGRTLNRYLAERRSSVNAP